MDWYGLVGISNIEQSRTLIDREIAQKGPQAERTIVTEGSAEPYGFFCQDSVDFFFFLKKHENSKGVAL